MKRSKNTTFFFLFSIIAVLFVSCSTTAKTTYSYNREDPYPGMEIVRYANSQAYAFPNEESDKLLIILEGGGWESVLGEKQGNIWTSVGYCEDFIKEFKNDYTILIPEKLKRQPGIVYREDMDDRANYTARNLLTCYNESINGYLTDHAFSSIVVIGFSEGAMLLPLIYEAIDNKNRVVAMVSISFGGLSMYESYKILSTQRSGFPQEWTYIFKDFLNTFDPEKPKLPDSFEEDYFDTTYRWISSSVHIRPFDYYKKITIPILFIHGLLDGSLPFESTVYIQENLPEKPFDYRYFHEMGHAPANLNQLIQFRKEIAEWIREIDK